MHILIDILHPAHVHFFRNFRTEMIERGHEVTVTARAKDVAVDLLEHYDIPHDVLSAQQTGLGLAGELVTRTARLLGRTRRQRPTALTGIMGPSIAPVGRLLRIPSVVFYDTEFATKTNRFVYPLASWVCTPDSYTAPVGGNHVTYPGYHELAYLHPDRFRPDPARLGAYGLEPGESYSVVRFVSWDASHDSGEVALTPDQKRRIVEELEEQGRVVVSSEGPLPQDLLGKALQGPVADVHHLLAFARVVVGESATISSEAAVLGTPAVFIATTGRGYTDDQERRYGLVRSFTPDRFDEALAAALEATSRSPQWRADRRDRLLADKIDVTGWMIDFFEERFDQ
jgi:predicted glycosyltransferase